MSCKPKKYSEVFGQFQGFVHNQIKFCEYFFDFYLFENQQDSVFSEQFGKNNSNQFFFYRINVGNKPKKNL